MAAAAGPVGYPSHQGIPATFDGKIVPSEPTFDYDVGVVGSGLSGLTTTYRLRQKGLSVVVIESSKNDVGGRTRSMDIPNVGLVSIGGTWSIFENDDTLSLAKEVDCLPFVPKTVPKLKNICSSLYTHPMLLVYLWYKGKKVCEQPGAWWTSQKAKELDRKSLAEWLHERLLFNEGAVKAVRDWFLLMETFDNPDLSTISALFAAVFMYYRFKGLDLFKDGLHLPQTLRWQGGTGVFVYAIIKHIKDLGENQFKITQGDPVRQITQLYLASDLKNPIGVEVTTAAGATYTVKRAVVAVNPLASTLTIRYRPTLPEAMSNVNQSVSATQNTSLNVMLVWSSAWWQEVNEGNVILPDWSEAPNGFTGLGVYGPVMDLSINGKGVFRILTMPMRVAGWSNDEIRNSSLEFLKKYFDKKYHNHFEPSQIEQCIIWNWMDEAPELPGVTYSMATGALSEWGSWLQSSFGRVHFGGTERSFHGINWMEGAVQRGNEVANEVLAAQHLPKIDPREFTNKKPHPNEFEKQKWASEKDIADTLPVDALGIQLAAGGDPVSKLIAEAKKASASIKATKRKLKAAAK